MAKYSLLCLTLLALFLPTITLSSSSSSSSSHHHHHHHHHHHGELKSLHFALYQHDIVNVTDYLVVTGVVGPNISETKSPLGTIAVLKDQLTLTPDPSSKVLGSVEGIAITSSFDGLDGLSVGRFELELEEGYKGSISISGVINGLKPSDSPVIGGTGDFMFVQGYVTASPVSFKGATYVYKQEFHLVWPPYATKALQAVTKP